MKMKNYSCVGMDFDRKRQGFIISLVRHYINDPDIMGKMVFVLYTYSISGQCYQASRFWTILGIFNVDTLIIPSVCIMSIQSVVIFRIANSSGNDVDNILTIQGTKL